MKCLKDSLCRNMVSELLLKSHQFSHFIMTAAAPVSRAKSLLAGGLSRVVPQTMAQNSRLPGPPPWLPPDTPTSSSGKHQGHNHKLASTCLGGVLEGPSSALWSPGRHPCRLATSCNGTTNSAQRSGLILPFFQCTLGNRQGFAHKTTIHILFSQLLFHTRLQNSD